MLTGKNNLRALQWLPLKAPRKANHWDVIVSLCVVVGMAASCGKKEKNDGDESADNSASSIIVTSGTGDRSRLTSIQAALLPNHSSTVRSAFSLTAGADTYTIQMTDCLSGYSATVTNSNLDGLEVYKGDRDCLAKLVQFTYNGRTYLPTAGDPFTTWQVGDIAKFDEAGEPGVEPLTVAVMSTLSQPILQGDTITYAFSEVLAGNGMNILWSTYGAAGRYTATTNTQLPTSFSVRRTELAGLTGAEQGQFRFTLECTTSIGITNICQNFDFTTSDYKLIEDTYNGAPNYGEMGTIFGSAGTSITLPGDRVAPGDEGTINGGFKTVVLNGPTPLATKPNMLLVIRNGANYQYLNIDVVVSTPYQQSPYPTIALFPFDDPDNHEDTSLFNPQNLTDNSTIAYGSGKFGQARAFNTAGTTYSMPSTSKLNLMSTKWTVEGWVNLAALPGANGDMPLVRRDNGAGQARSWSVLLRRNAAANYRLKFERSTNGTAVTVITCGTNIGVPALNTWYHFAFTYNNGATFAYWNGVASTCTDFAAGGVFAGADLKIGGAVGAIVLNGRLDDIRLSQTPRYTGGSITVPTAPYIASE